MGAYIGAVGANIQTANMMRCLPGMYDIKLIDAQPLRVHQHDADRALSRRRPAGGELCLERVVDEAARVTGIDPVAAPAQPDRAKAMPYKTAVGTTYDSGDFPAVLDGPGARRRRRFKARQAESEKEGKMRGSASASAGDAGGPPVEGTEVIFPGRQAAS